MVASAKLKLNTESLAESELIGVKDMMPTMLWIQNFLLEQGDELWWTCCWITIVQVRGSKMGRIQVGKGQGMSFEVDRYHYG